ncbi:MAG: hypothetical protein ABIP33_06450 [Pseudolysinimonas sp.]
MALAPLAAQGDVEALLGRALTTAEQSYITQLLTTASGLVREYCRLAFTQTLGDTIALQGTWSSKLELPQWPVTQVNSVQVNGSAMTADQYVWDRSGNLMLPSGSFAPDAAMFSRSIPQLWGPAGSIFAGGSSGPNWYGPGAAISVNYDHGFVTIPGGVINEVAGMVAAQFSVPVGILEERIGGYQAKYIRSPGAAMTLTDAAKMNLNRYRKRSASLPVGGRK